MLGVLADKRKTMTLDFKNAGDHIFLIGTSRNDISSSEYLYSYHNIKNSPAPYFDLEEEFNVQQLIKKLIAQNLIDSAHDVSDGGLFITLLESALPNNLGFDISTDEDIRKDAFLFGEAQSRIVVSVSEEKLDDFINFVSDNDIEFSNLGEVTTGEILIDGESWKNTLLFKEHYDNAIEKAMSV
jgi:phosphoribosylformylglycinamidine synthase